MHLMLETLCSHAATISLRILVSIPPLGDFTAVSMDASAEPGGAASPTVVFKRKRGPASRATTSTPSQVDTPASSSSDTIPAPSRLSRSQSASDSDSDDPDSHSTVVIKKKRSNNNPLVQSTGPVHRKKLADDRADDDEYALESDTAKPTYRDCYSTTSTTSDSLQKIRDDATKHSDWDLDTPSSALKDTPQSSNADGLYRGAKSYTSYIAARDDGTSSKMRSRGPIRQTTTVRTTSLMDYQPDICKDYKETGYCGFGDTCKFLHDRSDYLAGWQLDVLPNSTARGRQDILSDPEESEDEEVPFACLICRQPFTDPVVTRCGHYFCSSCAIKRFAKNSKCFACGKQTGGLFNSAKKVLDKMEAASRRKVEARAERSGWLRDDEPVMEVGVDDVG